jgi:tRNA uridine 5-carbamoylmethylation protein Kti12
VRIVYLETDRDIRMQRNNSRQAKVPEDVAGRMLRTTVPPMPFEAQTVEWISV